jgi:hypothetical protein
MNVVEADGSAQTYFEVMPSDVVDLAPDGVVSITIDGPGDFNHEMVPAETYFGQFGSVFSFFPFGVTVSIRTTTQPKRPAADASSTPLYLVPGSILTIRHSGTSPLP